MGIRELVKQNKITVNAAIAQLEKEGAKNSHAYGWLKRREERLKPKPTVKAKAKK